MIQDNNKYVSYLDSSDNYYSTSEQQFARADAMNAKYMNDMQAAVLAQAEANKEINQYIDPNGDVTNGYNDSVKLLRDSKQANYDLLNYINKYGYDSNAVALFNKAKAVQAQNMDIYNTAKARYIKNLEERKKYAIENDGAWFEKEPEGFDDFIGSNADEYENARKVSKKNFSKKIADDWSNFQRTLLAAYTGILPNNGLEKSDEELYRDLEKRYGLLYEANGGINKEQLKKALKGDHGNELIELLVNQASKDSGMTKWDKWTKDGELKNDVRDVLLQNLSYLLGQTNIQMLLSPGGNEGSGAGTEPEIETDNSSTESMASVYSPFENRENMNFYSDPEDEKEMDSDYSNESLTESSDNITVEPRGDKEQNKIINQKMFDSETNTLSSMNNLISSLLTNLPLVVSDGSMPSIISSKHTDEQIKTYEDFVNEENNLLKDIEDYINAFSENGYSVDENGNIVLDDSEKYTEEDLNDPGFNRKSSNVLLLKQKYDNAKEEFNRLSTYREKYITPIINAYKTIQDNIYDFVEETINFEDKDFDKEYNKRFNVKEETVDRGRKTVNEFSVLDSDISRITGKDKSFIKGMSYSKKHLKDMADEYRKQLKRIDKYSKDVFGENYNYLNVDSDVKINIIKLNKLVSQQEIHDMYSNDQEKDKQKSYAGLVAEGNNLYEKDDNGDIKRVAYDKNSDYTLKFNPINGIYVEQTTRKNRQSNAITIKKLDIGTEAVKSANNIIKDRRTSAFSFDERNSNHIELDPKASRELYEYIEGNSEGSFNNYESGLIKLLNDKKLLNDENIKVLKNGKSGVVGSVVFLIKDDDGVVKNMIKVSTCDFTKKDDMSEFGKDERGNIIPLFQDKQYNVIDLKNATNNALYRTDYIKEIDDENYTLYKQFRYQVNKREQATKGKNAVTVEF